jgi:hypothetical protein
MAPRRKADKDAEPTKPTRTMTRNRGGGDGGEAKKESPAKKKTVAKAAPPNKGRGGKQDAAPTVKMNAKMTSNMTALAEDYDVEGESVWSNNILAGDTQRHASGRLSRMQEAAKPDMGSLEQVRALAKAAEEAANGMQTGMGSEGGEGWDAFYAAATTDGGCKSLTETAVRELFGDALFSGATVSVEELTSSAEWWKLVLDDADDDDELLDKWRKLLAWFDNDEHEFVETAFVAIGREKTNSLEGGCVFPRMLLGRTAGGGIAGLLGIVVNT